MSGRTVKLGAAALALLALCERAAILPDGKFDDLMLSFGAFIEQQMDDSGALSSYYAWSDQPAPDRVSVYYPGEATFALAALYRVTDDPKWLRLAMRAAGHLIRRGKFLGVDLVVFPDAWLLCALALLYEQTADPSLLDYAERIADSMLAVQYLDENAPATAGGYLDPVFPRSTTAAVCAEGLGMLCRALLRRGDAARAEKYTSALLLTTGFQLRQQVTGQNDFFYLDPEGVRGGFFASAVDHRMRIDYTQHTLSSFVYALDVLRKVVR